MAAKGPLSGLERSIVKNIWQELFPVIIPEARKPKPWLLCHYPCTIVTPSSEIFEAEQSGQHNAGSRAKLMLLPSSAA